MTLIFCVRIYLFCSVLATADHATQYDGSREGWLPPVVDSIREDDHFDFDLADIMALSAGDVDHDEDILSDEQRQKFIDIHNIYRANTTGVFPAASDMKFMSYNTTLEFNAREYLRQCVMLHGYAPNDKMKGLQGQNLYKGSAKIISRPLYLFYMEHIWFYWNNRTCWQPPEKYNCGHMILMMWHNSSEMGAARRTHCFPLQSTMLFNVHYFSKGYIVMPGFQIYKYGWHCTRCDPGMLCHKNLCIRKDQCQELRLDCRCKLACQNCVRPDWKRCRCSPCKQGWDWEDCSYKCQNELDYTNAKCRYWITLRCSAEYWFLRSCEQHCQVCSLVKTGADPEDLCCGGKVCDPHYALDEKTCECKMMCPSYLCLYPPSTTTTTTTMKPTTTAATTPMKPTTTAIKTAVNPPTARKPTRPPPPPVLSQSSRMSPSSRPCLMDTVTCCLRIFLPLIMSLTILAI